jgi:hypothetical protein
MAKVKLSTKGFITLIVVMSFISFGLGYTVWKISGVPNLAPIDASAARDADGNRIGWTCFPAGTKIEMFSGLQANIENVKEGDLVISQTEEGERVVSTVSRLEAPIREHLCSIDFTDGDTLELTAEHPLYSKEGWKSIDPNMTYDENPDLLVEKLRKGDEIVKFDDTYAEIEKIECWGGDVQAYNLVLEGTTNTYFANGYLAHNKKNTIFVPDDDGNVNFDGGHHTGAEIVLPNGVDIKDAWTAPSDQKIKIVETVFKDDNNVFYPASQVGDCISANGGECTLVYQEGTEIYRFPNTSDVPRTDDLGLYGAQYLKDISYTTTGTGEPADCEGAPTNSCGACASSPECPFQANTCAYYSQHVYTCTDDCDEPPPVDPNICDGGGIVEQTISMEVGVPITVTGWAYDKTGIDTSAIVVRIDGVVSGNASTRAGCPTQVSSCNSTYANVITWSYTFTPTKETHTVAVSWKDIEGKTAANCSAAAIFEMKNVCEGGGIVTQTNSMEIGDPVNVVGWAYDTDGINESKIEVSVDGVLAGNATTASGCPTQSSSCDPTDPNVITWSYTFTSTKLAHVVSAVWEDTTGLTGIACQASKTFSLNLINPNWEMTKVASGVCDESDPDNIFIPVDYVVTVTNSSTSAQQIATVVDNLDTKVQTSWVVESSINPTGVLSGNTITWTLSGDLASFAAGESKTFTYTVIIPDDSFGTYVNVVVATPTDDSSSFSATETIIAQCKQPITGLTDTLAGRVIISSVIMLASAAYLIADGDNMKISRLFGRTSRMDRKRKSFEKAI